MQESPSWQLQIGTPAPAIAGDVFGYSGYDEHVARPVRRLEIGTPCPTLIISLGSEFRVSPISSRSTFTCQSLFVGPAASPVTVEHGGEEIPARCAPPSKLRWAWNEVSRLGGDARVNKLAASLGWSSRHFIAKFQEIAGLTPKAQARRWRFQKARTYLDQTLLSLAQVAALCGYSDQSHLTREFRELGSCTPAAYRTVRFSDLPGLPAEAIEAI